MFRIGEFSKIARVSGRLLRYYDEIGLLSPQSIDPETGYRYYSARQLPRLNRILVLKELGYRWNKSPDCSNKTPHPPKFGECWPCAKPRSSNRSRKRWH